MLVSVTSYSFLRWIKKGLETDLSIIKIAKDMGFDAIEFSTLNVPEGKTKEEWATMLAEEAKKQDLKVICYSVGGNLITGDLKEQVETLKQEVDIAAILGASLMRHDIGYTFPHTVSFAAETEKFCEAIREVADYAKTKGVKTMSENHGRYYQDIDRVEEVYYTVNHENYGVLIDIGNFLCADVDPSYAVGRLTKTATHVHLKDFLKKPIIGKEQPAGWIVTRGGNALRGTVLGDGVVPLASCLYALKFGGYNGYLTVEFEGPEEIDYALTTALKRVRALIN